VLSCKECGAEFNVGVKGASLLKKLCSKCRIVIDNLLDDDGNEVLERKILVRVNMRRQLSL
jgi:hypothetical protein